MNTGAAPLVATRVYHVELFEGRLWMLDVQADSHQEAVAKANALIDDGDPTAWLETASEEARAWVYTVAVPASYRWPHPEDAKAGRFDRDPHRWPIGH